MTRRWPMLLLMALMLVSVASAQNSAAQALNHPAKGVLQELSLSGMRSLDTSELNALTAELTGHEYREDGAELRERLANLLQEKGFFDAEITSFTVKPLDPLARPKPVRVEAEVLEGPRYRLGEVRLVGNRAFSAEQMRAEMPIQMGDYFGTDKVRSGLVGLRRLYFSHGYLNFSVMPKTTKGSDGTVVLELDVEDGPQFRMGTLEMNGNADLAQQLRSAWQLEPGSIFDALYPQKFVDDNKALLPRDFIYRSGVHVIRNCKELSVTVDVNLDPQHPAQPPKETGCEKPEAAPTAAGAKS